MRPGETLSGIAKQEGTTVQALVSANGLADPDRIVAGTVLAIPGAATGGRGGSANAPASYTVKPGDNLATIASRYGTTPGAIAKANGLANPNLVVIGKVLQVPGTTGVSGATGSTATLPARLRSSPNRLALRPTFVRWANTYGVSPALLEALCWNESGWQNSVVSSTGAVGIGQLMPDTVRLAQLFLGSKKLDPTVADDNIRMSAWFLGYLLQLTGGNRDLAVAAYYQGLRSVTTGPLLPETEKYVDVVNALVPLFS